MKKFIGLVLVVLLLLSTSSAYSAVGYQKNGAYVGPATDINIEGATDAVAWDGRKLTIYMKGPMSGVSTIVSTVSKLTSTHLAFGMLKLIGASKTFSMDEGLYEGQEITLIKTENDARTLKLDFSIDAVGDRTACTGWSSVTWSTAAGGWVTLTWIDSTYGWVITGSSPSGVTITY
ncbi:MAG: hypothetical protein WC481_08485 [Candidatus Omnitrophota bacterium]|jgi:hypothetical protein